MEQESQDDVDLKAQDAALLHNKNTRANPENEPESNSKTTTLRKRNYHKIHENNQMDCKTQSNTTTSQNKINAEKVIIQNSKKHYYNATKELDTEKVADNTIQQTPQNDVAKMKTSETNDVTIKRRSENNDVIKRRNSTTTEIVTESTTTRDQQDPTAQDQKSRVYTQLPQPLPRIEMAVYVTICALCFVFSAWYLQQSSRILEKDEDYSLFLQEEWTWLGHPKDTMNEEWSVWSNFAKRLVVAAIFHYVTSQLVTYFAFPYRRHVWLLTAVAINLHLQGWRPLLFYMTVTLSIYAASFSRSVVVTWCMGMVWLAGINANDSEWVKKLLIGNGDDDHATWSSVSLLYIAYGFLLCRVISFCVERAKRLNGSSELPKDVTFSLFDLLVYAFYAPYFYTGPMFVYKYFQAEVIKPRTPWTRPEITYIIQRILRCFIWAFLLNVFLHFIYLHSFGAISDLLELIPRWSVGAVICFTVTFYQAEYVVTYGLGGCLMMTDRITPPDTPRCVVRIAYFSEQWRNPTSVHEEDMFTPRSPRKSSNAARINEDQEDDNVSLRSGFSRRSMSMCSRSSSIDSSVARREALVKRASATAALEFEQQLLTKRRLMAEKEEELVRLLARERADNEQTMKVLAAQKAAAMADAELAAIDQAILEENGEENRVINAPDITQDGDKSQHTYLSRDTDFSRAHNIAELRDGVKGQPKPTPNRQSVYEPIVQRESSTVKNTSAYPSVYEPIVQRKSSTVKNMSAYPSVYEPVVQHESSTVKNRSAYPYPPTSAIETNIGEITSSSRNTVAGELHADATLHHTQGGNAPNLRGFAGNEPIYKPIKFNNPPRDQCYRQQQSFDSQLFASTLARQNLPKYEPDVFTGDVTFYHTWKGSFQAMLDNTNVTAAQEMLYLHNYTRSDPRKLVDSYRRRVYGNPDAALADIWSALDTKYGNTAAITRTYLESLEIAAKFRETDRERLDDFSSLCIDIDSQMSYLPGLACLNYVNVLQPLITKLPRYPKQEWEKIVVRHADAKNNEYPPFSSFSEFIEKQAKLKNHPNVLDMYSTKSYRECNTELHDDNATPTDHVEFCVMASSTVPNATVTPTNNLPSVPTNSRPTGSGSTSPINNRAVTPSHNRRTMAHDSHTTSPNDNRPNNNDRSSAPSNDRHTASNNNRPGAPNKNRSSASNNDRQTTYKNKPHRAETFCPLHRVDGHDLSRCTIFEHMDMAGKWDIARDQGLCFRCLGSWHSYATCDADVKCQTCGSTRHGTLFHEEDRPENSRRDAARNTSQVNIRNKCTAVCGNREGGVSCNKTILVDVFPENRPHMVRRLYALIDDQSNASMATPELLDDLGCDSKPEKFYLSTCSSQKEVQYGRKMSGLIIRSVSGETESLPPVFECDCIPQERKEIPTPDIARKFEHLRNIADELPPLDDEANVMLLIGRDAPELLKVRDFINGPPGSPWAQKLRLGWTVSGQICLDRLGGAVHIAARKTSLSDNNRTTLHDDGVKVEQCCNQFTIKKAMCESDDIFKSTRNDDETSLSQEDRRFIDIMNKGYHKNAKGNCEMPLPFHRTTNRMPNNRQQAERRLHSLHRNFARKPHMMNDYVEFMGKLFERDHAEEIPESDKRNATDGNVWYLPHFGIYHPKKPTQIRVVFDASAEFRDVSLNKMLLTGPDTMNSLLGILLRFRKDNIALLCDVEQMFHSFYVNEEDRDYLRFLWYKNNDPSQEIVECRMKVHLFGNGSSPAVATYGLRRTADEGKDIFGKPANEFVQGNFYVDDGLISCATEDEAITLIKATQQLLQTSNLRLHKVASNSVAVMNSLPEEDRAKAVQAIDLEHDDLPSLRSLGVFWNMQDDVFTYKVCVEDRPFTRRGVLSITNALFDPLGFVSPVVVKGKILLQELTVLGNKDSEFPLSWDDPLPTPMLNRWLRWKNELSSLENVRIPRCYHPADFGNIVSTEIHAFSDASNDALGVAIYLRLVDDVGRIHVSLIFGQTKVTPTRPTSTPRLELCAAVMSTQAVHKVTSEMDMHVDRTYYYTDSTIVLGYIQNTNRRYYVYVANRVEKICALSDPCQWRHVATDRNPADLASRGVRAPDLNESMWFRGPEFLRERKLPIEYETSGSFDIVENDPEVRESVNVCRTTFNEIKFDCRRFERFSSWHSVMRAVANVTNITRRFKTRGDRSPGNDTYESPTVADLSRAETVILKALQRETFDLEDEVANQAVQQNNTSTYLSRRVKLYKLNPFVDDKGIMRVGGRLRRSEISDREKHPVILPKNHHLTRLIIRHYHDKVHHQGRVITHGALRSAGFWIVGGQSEVSQTIHNCVTCRRLRGPLLTQHMSDLPFDRLEEAPPFTNVGMDCFGPWTIVTKKLRGGVAENKRWGLVFTCLVSRAIHLEILESMDSSSFICALRRFIAIRGPIARLRCDRGTNFVGGKNELDQALSEIDTAAINNYLKEQECEWVYNVPHASHHGGVWERQIHTIRRVLDSMLMELGSPQLTHELLVTLLAEVSGIVNARPITTITADSEEPMPLTPSMLLTTKSRPYTPIPGCFTRQDIYSRKRWKRVQYLADQFWTRWRREYVQNLQSRPKWTEHQPNVQVGDVVMLKDDLAPRYTWSLARVLDTFESDDDKVRKSTIMVCKDGVRRSYVRPISELVLLVRAEPTPPEDHINPA